MYIVQSKHFAMQRYLFAYSYTPDLAHSPGLQPNCGARGQDIANGTLLIRAIMQSSKSLVLLQRSIHVQLRYYFSCAGSQDHRITQAAIHGNILLVFTSGSDRVTGKFPDSVAGGFRGFCSPCDINYEVLILHTVLKVHSYTDLFSLLRPPYSVLQTRTVHLTEF